MVRYSLAIVAIFSQVCSVTLEAAPARLLEDVDFAQVQALDYRSADQRLSYGLAESQFGELWLAANTGGDTPLLVLVHGGCWLNEYGIDHIYALASALSASGYNVFALEYRRLGDEGGGWPGSFEDVQAGIGYTAQLQRLGVSNRIMAIIGHSAGGHLALLAGAAMAASGNAPRLVVGLAAITDLTAYARGNNSCQAAVGRFMGATPAERPAFYRQASPAAATISDPTWLLQGDADSIVPVSQARLPDAGVEIVAGAGHFDWLHPGTRAYRRLLDLLRETLR